MRPAESLREHENDLPACYLLHAGFLHGLFYDPEDEDNNICWLSMEYKALFPKRQKISQPRLWEPQVL
jgi:hypothetical protein